MIDKILGDGPDLNLLRALKLIAIQVVNLQYSECSYYFQVYTPVYQSTICK